MKCNAGFILLSLLLILSGCKSKAVFTSSLKTEIETKGLSVQKVQYYVDRDITIRKEVSADKAKVTDGQVNLLNGKYVQLITLRKNIPGVCLKDSAGVLSIAFEGGERSFFQFKPSDQTGIYHLLLHDTIGNILYNDNLYMVEGDGQNAKLTIRKKVVDQLQVKKRKMKGVKL